MENTSIDKRTSLDEEPTVFPTLPETEQPEPEEKEKEAFIQLIYMSAATIPFSEQDLTQLLSLARKNNESLGVSGLLIYHEGSFLQVLEGPEETVFQLYNHIHKDTRHDEVTLLLKHEVMARSFGSWKMGYINTNNPTLRKDEGFVDFFRKGFSLPVMRADKSRLGKVLREFKHDGKWRADIS